MRLLKKGVVEIPKEYAGPTDTERLVKSYMKKYSDRNVVEGDGGGMDEEMRKHDKLMGRYRKKSQGNKYEDNTFNFDFDMPSVNNPELLKSKSIVVSNAYQFAIKQMEYQACNPDIDEEESFKAVEELLLREDKDERLKSREIRDSVVKEQEKKSKDAEKKMKDIIEDIDDADIEEEEESSTIPSILHNKPRIALQLAAWGDRLRQVPYKDWSVGAITALDHWIATNVLEISENNWEKMLAGEEDIGTSRIRDLLVIRGALFPETLQDEPPTSLAAELDDEDVSMQSINQILQDLSNDNNDDMDDEDDVGANTPFSFDDDDEDDVLSTPSKRQDFKLKLTQELQVHRNTHHNKQPYEKWSDEEKQAFDTFFDDYISFFVQPHERRHLDMEETKHKLLNMLPNNKDDNDEFWNKMEDETTIELFLDELKKRYEKITGDVPSTTKEFMELPYQTQKERLMTLSTLRPMYDEYGSDEDYDTFFQANKEILLKSVPLETLIEDPEGHITSDNASLLEGEDKDKAFKLGMEEYGEDELYQRKKKMLEVWRLYKLKRAKVEEEMFRKGELGLKYAEKEEDEK